MGKRVTAILLAISVLFAQTLPAFADEVLLIDEETQEQFSGEEPVSEGNAEQGLFVEEIEPASESDEIAPSGTESESEFETEGISESELVETEAITETDTETSGTGQSETPSDSIVIEDVTVDTAAETLEVNEEEEAEAAGYAAGSTMSTATPISIGYNYSGTISDTNTIDYYKFTVPSSGRINLVATADMKYISYEIHSSDGETLWNSNPSWNSITHIISTDVWLDLTRGTYYFKAIRKYGENGNYSFKINFTDAGESFAETGSGTNNSMSSASAVLLNTEYRGQIAANDDRDFYRFTLPKSGNILLTATSWIYHTNCYVYDSAGTQVWDSGYKRNGTTGIASISESLNLTAGTYYLVIDGYYYDRYTGNYSFKLSYTDAGESFAESGNGTNNTIYAANPIALQTRYQGQLAINDSKDFYQFTVASSGNITVAVNAGIYRAYFRIYDSAGNRKWSTWESWNSTTQRIDFSKEVKLTAGTYYFVVEKYDNNTGNYSFSLSAHVHSYTYTVTKATTSSNGKIVGKCSCGETDTSTIYRPGSASLSPSSYVYDGKAKRPSVTVWGSDGRVIGPENYTVTYGKGRKDVGSYSVTITFKGNYSGTLQRYFYIYPKKTSIARLTAKSRGFSVKINKKKKQVSGYQIQYAGNKAFRKAKTKELNGSSKVSATYSGLKGKKKYFVRVRTYKKVGSQRYYSAWSNAKTVVTKR